FRKGIGLYSEKKEMPVILERRLAGGPPEMGEIGGALLAGGLMVLVNQVKSVGIQKETGCKTGELVLVGICRIQPYGILTPELYGKPYGIPVIELFGKLNFELYGVLDLELFGKVNFEPYGIPVMELFGRVKREPYGIPTLELFGKAKPEPYGVLWQELFGLVGSELYGVCEAGKEKAVGYFLDYR
ncbi:unnamed protein product, partial [Effrenium voratum]